MRHILCHMRTYSYPRFFVSKFEFLNVFFTLIQHHKVFKKKKKKRQTDTGTRNSVNLLFVIFKKQKKTFRKLVRFKSELEKKKKNL